jgi:hypothetical protein
VQGEELAATNRPNKGKVALALVQWLIVVMPVGGKVDGTKTSVTEGKSKDEAEGAKAEGRIVVVPVLAVGKETDGTETSGTVGKSKDDAEGAKAEGRIVVVPVVAVGKETDGTETSATEGKSKDDAEGAKVEGRIVVVPVLAVGKETDGTEPSGSIMVEVAVFGGEASSPVGNINVEAGATKTVGRMVEVAVVGGEASSTVGNINVEAGATPAVGRIMVEVLGGEADSTETSVGFFLAKVLPLALAGGPGAGWKRLPIPIASIPSREGVKFFGSLGEERA